MLSTVFMLLYEQLTVSLLSESQSTIEDRQVLVGYMYKTY
jgi:hypothetical protein